MPNVFWNQTSTGCIPLKNIRMSSGIVFFVCVFLNWFFSWYINHDLSPPFGIKYVWFTFYQVSEVKQIRVILRWHCSLTPAKSSWLDVMLTKHQSHHRSTNAAGCEHFAAELVTKDLWTRSLEEILLAGRWRKLRLFGKLEMLWTPNWVNWGLPKRTWGFYS